MIKLRPYEERAVKKLLELFRQHRRIVAVAPTGSGKTVIGAALIRALKGKRVLWLAHRIELLRQAYDHLKVAGIPENELGILSGPMKINTNARILIAGVAMFRTRLIPKVDLIVVDEAHHVAATTYRDILDVCPTAVVLGLTATPWRLDGEPLGDVFEHLHVMAEAVELIPDGYIVEAVVYGIPQDKAKALVAGLKSSGADYSARKLEQIMRKRPLMGDVITEWNRLAEGLSTIVYACTIEHGKELMRRFRAAGVACEFVDWSTPAGERDAVLGKNGRLATGETTVVVNVAVLTEGLDCPPVKCILIARPTKSLTLYRQMCGRGSRPHGKRRHLVLDHAGNVWRHGLPDMPLEWSLTGRLKGSGPAPLKRCEECGAMNLIARKACTECGTEFPITPRELAERQAALERILATEAEKTAARKRIEQIAKEKNVPIDWVNRVMNAVF